MQWLPALEILTLRFRCSNVALAGDQRNQSGQNREIIRGLVYSLTNQRPIRYNVKEGIIWYKAAVAVKSKLFIGTALLSIVIILGGACAQQQSTPPVTYSLPELKYRLISNFDDLFD